MIIYHLSEDHDFRVFLSQTKNRNVINGKRKTSCQVKALKTNF